MNPYKNCKIEKKQEIAAKAMTKVLMVYLSGGMGDISKQSDWEIYLDDLVTMAEQLAEEKYLHTGQKR
jgi:hypothetical protein